jgi:hypothetical protein
MPKFIYTIVLVLAGITSINIQQLAAQSSASTEQLQEAIQIRIENLVRSSANSFYEKSLLPPPELNQIVAKAQFVQAHSGFEVSSLDLNIEINSDDPPEIIRQLRQYLAQVLSREGFSVDQAVSETVGAPTLALTLEVVTPPISGFDFNFRDRWPDYLRFAMIILAFLSSLVFLGYLFLLPAASRRRRLRKLNDLSKHRPVEQASGLKLPPLPVIDFDQPIEQTTLRELHELDEQHIQKYPVWVDPSGARMSDLEGIRKAFEVLPFEEALDMLSCMEEGERNVILNQLRLNPSVKAHIKKELEKKEAAAGQPVPSN